VIGVGVKEIIVLKKNQKLDEQQQQQQQQQQPLIHKAIGCNCTLI